MLENVPKHALSCTGVGKKAARSLLGGSLVRLAGTTDLVQVHFGTVDTKGHRVLLLRVGLHYSLTLVTVLAMYIPVGLGNMLLLTETADLLGKMARVLLRRR